MNVSNEREEQATRGRAVRILIAEEDDAMRAFLVRSLKGAGYEVLEVRNGEELRSYFQSAATRPQERLLDLIVSDISLPGKSEIEVLLELRRMIENTPVILITAFGDARLHEQALRLGATAVIDKPFNMEELKRFVANAVPGVRAPGGSLA